MREDRNMSLANILRASMVLLCGAALVGCAAQGGRKGPDKRPLEVRAAERAQLYANGRFAEAWEFTTPGHRAAVPLQTYVDKSQIKPVKWLEATFVGTDCPEGEIRCEAILDVKFQTQVPTRWVGRLTLDNRIRETWIKIDGVWYFLPPDFK
jgi:hypothetical protein